MIAVCPKCRARYRVDTTRIPAEGMKLRCAQCTALFLVRVPVAATPAPSASAAESTTGLVVVADADHARAKRCADALRSWGLGVVVVHDGVEAMLAIQRRLPRAVVLDAALPRMSGAQVCEIVKRNASLCGTQVVMIGPAHPPSRDASTAADRFGADAELEPADLPDGLRACLARCGLVAPAGGAPGRALPSAPPTTPTPPTIPTPPAPAVRVVPPAPPSPVAAPPAPAPAPEPADAARQEERERARRLARIAVSEMLLYQPEKFAQAAREGTLERVLELEIQEARALIRQRIGPEVRAEADFVLDELHRVARERGGRT